MKRGGIKYEIVMYSGEETSLCRGNKKKYKVEALRCKRENEKGNSGRGGWTYGEVEGK